MNEAKTFEEYILSELTEAKENEALARMICAAR